MASVVREENPVAEIMKSFDNSRKRFASLKENLRLAIEDHEFIHNRNRTIRFAIDAYQIFKYAFPIMGIVSRDKRTVVGEEERILSMNRHAARAFIFFHMENCPKPFLLPPHAHELVDIWEMLKDKKILFGLEFDCILDWGLEEFELNERERIHRAHLWFKKNPTGDPKEEPWFEEIVHLLDKRYHDLLLLVSGSITEGLKILDGLFADDNPRVRIAHEAFDEKYASFIDSVARLRVTKWFDIFNNVRGKWFSDIRDSKAVDIVEALNRQLQTDDKCESVFLISDASSMDRSLNWDIYKSMDEAKYAFIEDEAEYPKGFISIDKKPVRILRTTDVFLTYLLLRERGDWKQTRSNMLLMQNRVDRFLELEGQINNIHKMCELHDFDCRLCREPDDCLKLRKEFRDYGEYIREFSSMSLAEKGGMILDPYIQLQLKIEKSIRLILEFLTERSQSFISLVSSKKDEYQKAIEKSAENLYRYTEGLSGKLTIDLGNRLRRVSGLPFRIKFSDREISDSIEILVGAAGDPLRHEENEILDASNRLVDYMYDESKGENRDLLNAVFNHIYGRNETAIRIADVNLGEEKLDLKSEFLFVKSLSHLRSGISGKSPVPYKDAMETAKTGMNENKNDPRFPNLMGTIIGEATSRHLEIELSEDDALNNLKQSLVLWNKYTRQEIDLGIAIRNNIAYLVVQKQDPAEEEMEHAARYLDEMEQLSDGNLTHIPYLDTQIRFIMLKIRQSTQPTETNQLLTDGKQVQKAILTRLERDKPFPYQASEFESTLKEFDRLCEAKRKEVVLLAKRTFLDPRRKKEILEWLYRYEPRLQKARAKHIQEIRRRQEGNIQNLAREPAWFSLGITPSEKKNGLRIGLRTRGCTYWRESPNGIGCFHCGYGSSSLLDVMPTSDELLLQFDKALTWAEKQNYDYDVIELLNVGSFLNEDEYPSEFVDVLFERLADLNWIIRVLVETRPEYITESRIENLLSRLQNGQQLEIGIGLETMDDFVREACIYKGFAIEEFEEAINLIHKFGNRCRTVAYILLKPAFLTEKEAIDDAIETVKYLSQTSEKCEVEIVPKLEPAMIHKGTLLDVLHFDVSHDTKEHYAPLSYWSVIEILAKAHLLGIGNNIRIGAREDMGTIEKVPGIYNNDGTFNQYDFWIYDAVQRYNVDHDIVQLVLDAKIVMEEDQSYECWKNELGLKRTAFDECLEDLREDMDRILDEDSHKRRVKFLRKVCKLLVKIELRKSSHEFAKKLKSEESSASADLKERIGNFINEIIKKHLRHLHAEIASFFFERDGKRMLRIHFQLRDLKERKNVCDIWVGIPTR